MTSSEESKVILSKMDDIMKTLKKNSDKLDKFMIKLNKISDIMQLNEKAISDMTAENKTILSKVDLLQTNIIVAEAKNETKKVKSATKSRRSSVSSTPSKATNRINSVVNRFFADHEDKFKDYFINDLKLFNEEYFFNTIKMEDSKNSKKTFPVYNLIKDDIKKADAGQKIKDYYNNIINDTNPTEDTPMTPFSVTTPNGSDDEGEDAGEPGESN
jgi:hypothetical protein